jgi:ADP-heptose:LPS heptosyltransferase
MVLNLHRVTNNGHEDKKKPVFFARSYEEARTIELTRAADETSTFILNLKQIFVRLWVFLVNGLLSFLNRLFFTARRSQFLPSRIAVYTVGTLGDNVLMLPAIAAIKNAYPTVRITAIVNCDGFSDNSARAILGPSTFIDELVTLPNHPVQRQGFRLLVNIPPNFNRGFDLFVNLSPFGNRGWIGAVVREMVYAKKLGAKMAVGFNMSTYSRKNIFNSVQHHFVKNEARRIYHVLETIDIQPVAHKDLLPMDKSAKRRVAVLISSHISNRDCPVAVINPGAKLAASHWPAERFGAIAMWLKQKHNAAVFVNGTESEKQICERVVNASGGAAVDFSGKLSIQELIELLRMSSILVTNNTGPMTLAGMSGTPMVVVASTRFSPAFYMPESDRMVWVFSFDENSYSYDDSGGAGKDLLNIEIRHVQNAIEMLDAFADRRSDV